MEPQIRFATPSDIPVIFTIRISVTENALPLPQLTELGITPASIGAAISASPCAWVAEVGEEVVGFAMVDGDDACVFAAFVLPSYEGQGIGRQLMAAAEAKLFAWHGVIWLETAEGSRACGFYRALGWRVVEVLEAGDVRMEKVRG